MRIRIILQLAALSLPMVIIGCTDPSGEVNTVYGNESWTVGELAEVPYERGKKRFADGQFGVAVRDFEEALVRDPRSVETLNALAAAYDQLGRFDLSERYYLRALSLDPNSVQSLNNMGYSYLMQRRYDLAMTYLRDAKKLEPANSFVAQNIQKAEAATDLADSDFKTAPIQDGWFEHYAGSAPRARSGETTAVAMAVNAAAVNVAADAEEDAVSDDVVHIVAFGASPSPWIERTAPVIQSLVTQPSPEIDLAAREWGVRPALANYRPQSALEASAERRIPWEVIERPATSETLEASPANLPVALLPSADGSVVSAPLVSVEQVALAPVNEVAHFRMRPVSLLPDMDLMPPIEAAQSVTTPMNLVPDDLVAADEPNPEAEGPIDLLPADFTVNSEIANPDFLAERTTDEGLPRVEIANGTGRTHMASRVGGFLEDHGFPKPRLTNAEHFGFAETIIYYRDGWLDQARRLTAELPSNMVLEAAPDQAVDIRVRLGGDLLIFDRELMHADWNPASATAG